MEWLNDPDAWIGLLTLTVLELVLGIDNIVFISILSVASKRRAKIHAPSVSRLNSHRHEMWMRILPGDCSLLCVEKPVDDDRIPLSCGTA